MNKLTEKQKSEIKKLYPRAIFGEYGISLGNDFISYDGSVIDISANARKLGKVIALMKIINESKDVKSPQKQSISERVTEVRAKKREALKEAYRKGE